MLYPTLMPSTFNPFSPFNSSQNLVNSPSPQFQGMEGLRGGLGVENDGYGGGAGEDFCVEELLDLSNGFSETEEELPEMEMGNANQKMDSPVLELEEKREETPLVKQEFELTVEAEGLESLEWLSHFVEDSFSDYSLTGKFPSTAAVVEEQPCFTIPVQTKARTKRARGGSRVWPVLSSSFTDSPTSSSSSTTSFPTTKKQKRSDGGAAAQPRRCSHCGVTKTPQWRAGPLGAKTLCNACGVRFKSGRLLPEYRPACSPTFSSELHSNNHRKVLEMRRKKEGAAGSEFLRGVF